MIFSCVTVLIFWSPHKLLKNLDQNTKNLTSLLFILDTMEWSRKPSHAIVPLMYIPIMHGILQHKLYVVDVL